eukprot:1190621-Prorocentrum_minimum.AAC.2
MSVGYRRRLAAYLAEEVALEVDEEAVELGAAAAAVKVAPARLQQADDHPHLRQASTFSRRTNQM